MSKYALIEANAVIEVRNMPPGFNPADVAHKFDWRVVNILATPAIDPATEKIGPWNYVINPSDVDAQRTVVAKTQQEQNDYAQGQADAAERAIVKALYQALKNGTGTTTQRLARVERVAARLLRDAYGSD